MQLPTTLRASSRPPLVQAVKVAIATVAAWLVCSLVLPGELPVFGTIAALLVVQPSVSQSFGKAIERSLGVVVGVLIAYGVALVFHRQGWVVLLAIVVAIFVGWGFRLVPGSANQIPISAMLVLSIGSQNPDYAFARIVETVIGALIALIVNLAIAPPVRLDAAHDRVHRLADEVAGCLDDLAEVLREPASPSRLTELLVDARLLRPMREKADASLTEAAESLTLNPRRRRVRERFEADRALYARLEPLITQTTGMARAVHDNYDPGLLDEPGVPGIVSELTRAAHDLRLHAADAAEPVAPRPLEAEPPALTAPLALARPSAEHWVLIGSLTEDLRRVHAEIAGE